MHCFVEMLDKKLSCTCLSCGCPEAVVEDYIKKKGTAMKSGFGAATEQELNRVRLHHLSNGFLQAHICQSLLGRFLVEVTSGRIPVVMSSLLFNFLR